MSDQALVGFYFVEFYYAKSTDHTPHDSIANESNSE